jgi:hypothetical protein
LCIKLCQFIAQPRQCIERSRQLGQLNAY